MKKNKLLILSLLTLISSSAWGQSWTDVTGTYLDNADFSDPTTITNQVVNTYESDIQKNGGTSGQQAVASWVGNDTSDAHAGGAFTIGSDHWIAGSSYAVPATNPAGKAEGYVLGLAGCWGSSLSYSQDLKKALTAGKYKFEIKGYNANPSATAFGAQTIGVKESNGTTHYVTATWTSQTWVTATIEFSVASYVEGTVIIGAGNIANGSGSSAKMFFTDLKLYVDNTVDKTNLNALITKAEGLYSVSGVGAATFKTAIDAAKAVSTNTGATIAEVLSAETDLQAAIKTYHIANPSEEHPYDMTDEIGNIGGSITGWTSTTGAQNNVYKTSTEKNNGEYTATGFIENWNKNNFTGEIFYTLTNLYAGHYKVSAYAFDSPKSGSVYFYANDKEVALDNSTDLFTNPTLTDVLVGENGIMKLGLNVKEANTNWVGITNIKLEYIGLFTEADKITAAKADLLTAIKAKPAISANVGDGAFQYSTANADSYNKILTDAQDVYDNPSATLADVNTAKESVTSATLPTLNGPKANTRYALVLKYEGWAHDNKAVTYIANGRSDAGNYNIQYLTPVNVNYAQAFIFTPVEGDKYKLSQIDADGNERFVCTGVPYGGNTSQIRTTTTADAALLVEVRATATEGKWNLWNTEANNYIGSQDAGVFTVNSHIDFEIVEAKEIPGITITAAKYATFIAPVAVTIPSEVTAYSCAEVDGTTLTLTEIETTIPANTPAILYAEGGHTGESLGYSNANPAENTNTAGLLTGVYADTEISEGYVLVNRDGAKFVVVNGTSATVPANRAYLTVPSEVKEFALEDATGIAKVVPAFGSDNESVFNLAGQRVSSDFKGIVIKNGKKQLNK